MSNYKKPEPLFPGVEWRIDEYGSWVTQVGVFHCRLYGSGKGAIALASVSVAWGPSSRSKAIPWMREYITSAIKETASAAGLQVIGGES